MADSRGVIDSGSDTDGSPSRGEEELVTSDSPLSLLLVTKCGLGKRVPMELFRQTSRACRGVKAIRVRNSP
eukprot:9483521-Pyramimonas_sp.AAC.1